MNAIGPVKGANLKPKFGVLADGGPGQQSKVLQNKAGLRARADERLTVDFNLSALGVAQAGQQIKQGSFAAARWPKHRPGFT